jgi:hypothetical protein
VTVRPREDTPGSHGEGRCLLTRAFGGVALRQPQGAMMVAVTDSPIREGQPHPRGATWDGKGVNFALFSAHGFDPQ